MQITAPAFDESELQLVRECLQSGWVTQGRFTEQFEQLTARRHQVAHAFAATSCTAALHIATSALELGPGDEVVVPAFTWVTSAHCAEYVGAKAVFADVRPETFNLDPAALEAAITPRTRAVVAVHLFGLAADMEAILATARRHDLAVIEDAACAIGASYRGRPVGGFGDIGCFSFHPRKVITTGEGGMVTTRRDDLVEAIKALRNHGATGVVTSPDAPSGPWTMATFNRLGFNLRLSDIQAAVGVAQFAKLERLLDERRRLALHYSEMLAGVDALALPTDAASTDGHTFQSYVIRVLDGGYRQRNRIMSEMAAANIQTRPGTHAVHRLGYYRNKYGLQAEDFPVAAACEDTTITLPIFPNMRESDQERVVDCLRRTLSGSGF